MSSTVGVGGHGSGYGGGAGGVGGALGAPSLGSSLHESRLDAMPSEKAPAISSSSRPSFVTPLPPHPHPASTPIPFIQFCCLPPMRFNCNYTV